jgi:hypothetical protein
LAQVERLAGSADLDRIDLPALHRFIQRSHLRHQLCVDPGELVGLCQWVNHRRRHSQHLTPAVRFSGWADPTAPVGKTCHRVICHCIHSCIDRCAVEFVCLGSVGLSLYLLSRFCCSQE